MHRRHLILACFAAALLLPTPAATLPAGYRVETVHTDLDFPSALRFAPDGRLFYLELQTGRVMMYRHAFDSTPIIWTTVALRGQDEWGLLGIEFHPDYPESQFVYLLYTSPSTPENRLVRFRDMGTYGADAQLLFRLPAPEAFHLGGRLAFGPDRMLYVTYGDQGNMDAAGDPGNVRGKIHRLGLVGQPAPDNPFGPGNTAALAGVRNVFGICFDPEEGTGYFTENGPECDDEVNLIALGEDYGWSTGDLCGGQPAGAFPAITRFTPTIAPTGCCIYRGGAYGGHLDGDLFLGGFLNGNLHRIVFKPGNPSVADTVEVFMDNSEGVLDVTVGPDGLLWYCTFSGIHRIVPPNVTGIAGSAPAPAGLDLAPNPFSDAVRIQLEGRADRLEVLDHAGRRIRSWVPAGRSQLRWDGRDGSGRAVPSGVYLVRATGPGLVITRRVVRVAR